MAQKFDIYSIESDNLWPNYGDWQTPERAKSIIYMFGRDESKKKIIKKIANFFPYFYIKANSKIPITAQKYIRAIKASDKVNFAGEKVDKLEAINSKVVPILRSELERYNIEHFSADVLYRLNFTLNHYKDLEEQGIGFGIDNCRVCVLDIETTTREDNIDIANTPEDIISISLHDNYTNTYHTFIWRKDFEEKEEKREDKVIHYYNNEITMLNNFLDFWQMQSFDIVTGWNISGFDMPYIINRLKKLNLNTRALSPIGRVWCWEQKPDKGEEGETYYNAQVLGVVILDALKWYREVYLNQLRSYSLDNVAKDEGLGIKEKINPESLWINDFERLIEYNVNDVYLTKAIIEKRKIIDFVSGIRKLTWSNFDDLTYFSRSIDMLLLQEANKRGVVLPTKPSGIKYKSKEEREAVYAGGYVFAEKGIYHNGIGVFDFSALYPSIYKTFNISYETLNFENGGIEFEIPVGVEEEGQKIKVWVSQNKKGLIPSILENLAILREKYEIGLREAKTIKEVEDYDNLIQATKNLILTSYGTTAMQSFRLFKREVSALVTYIGRTLIREVARYVKSKNMRVCYNDTDSVFIVLRNENPEEGLKLQNELNQHIKEFCLEKWNISFERNLLELKFEKLFRSMLVDTKKRYAGYLIWKKGKVRDEINITGIQARRSDSSLQIQYLQPKIIELILKDKSIGEIEKVIFEELDKIKNCTDYEYISLPVRLGKEKYVNDVPKARGVEYAKEFLNVHLMVGMKPLLVYIKHGKEDALCFEHNKQLEGKEMKINIEKMCERNIFLPLQSILEIWKGEDYFNALKLKIINIVKGQRDLGDWSQIKSEEITPFH